MIEAKEQGSKAPIDDILEEVSFDDMQLFTAEKEMYGEILEDVRVIMTEYFQYWEPRDLKFLPVKGRYAEHEFELEIGKYLIFKGQVDGLGITPNKLKWLVEHKTFTNLPSDDHRWRNLQSVVYIHAVEQLGWMKGIDGVAWNYIKSKPPTIPKMTAKSGRLSERDIVTLPSVVRRVLKDNEMHERDYPKLMERAEAAREEYFQRIFTPVNRTVSGNIFSGFVDSSHEMRKNHGIARDKNIGRHCEWCDYEPICRAELTGGDPDFVKEREFIHEDPEAYRRSKRDSKDSPDPSPRRKDSPQLRVLREKRNGKDNPRVRFSEAGPPPGRKGRG